MLKHPLLKNSGWDFFDSLTNEHSRSIFSGVPFGQLSVNEQHRVIGFFDTAGSISSGEFGFGHNSEDYKLEDNAGRHGNDAFANMYVAVTRGYTEYKEAYPNLWDYMEKLLKK